MPKISTKKIKHFITMKEQMSEEQKRRLLIGLKAFRENLVFPVKGGESNINRKEKRAGSSALKKMDSPSSDMATTVAKDYMKKEDPTFSTRDKKREIDRGAADTVKKMRANAGLPTDEEYTGNIGGETDIANADNLVAEDDIDKPTENVIAKTQDTTGDFDNIVNEKRGIQMTPKEKQSIVNFKKATPTQQDDFFVKYEVTDDFGNNTTVVIKKLGDEGGGSQFCWTAFTKHENAEDEETPQGGGDEKPEKEDEGEGLPSLEEMFDLFRKKPKAPEGTSYIPEPKKEEEPEKPIRFDPNFEYPKKGKEAGSSGQGHPMIEVAPQPQGTPAQPAPEEEEELTVEDPIRIIKSIPFTDDINGANILSEFLGSGKLGI